MRWVDDAACVGTDPESFFPQGNSLPDPAVIRVCGGCEVRAECLQHAMDHPWLDGVWGGLGPGQRQLIRKGLQTAAYYEPRRCEWCGTLFPVAHGNQKYCDKTCSHRAHDFRSGRRRTGPPATRGG